MRISAHASPRAKCGPPHGRRGPEHSACSASKEGRPWRHHCYNLSTLLTESITYTTQALPPPSPPPQACTHHITPTGHDNILEKLTISLQDPWGVPGGGAVSRTQVTTSLAHQLSVNPQVFTKYHSPHHFPHPGTVVTGVQHSPAAPHAPAPVRITKGSRKVHSRKRSGRRVCGRELRQVHVHPPRPTLAHSLLTPRFLTLLAVPLSPSPVHTSHRPSPGSSAF
ncbi:hypothetical protein E2C01_014303 [Portunus trituberculatus]|uniref:Uncharacterized protein n=1 Tax=Portunus trituberculatus TaxID=210409 RepID=A0A5B7DIF6_PORTR|nr:hypothetical protein [Portunus trituberculatus]